MRDRTELRATALHLASFNGNDKLFDLLVEAGADIMTTTSSGVNSMHMASQGNQPYILDRLLYHYKAFDINVKD